MTPPTPAIIGLDDTALASNLVSRHVVGLAKSSLAEMITHFVGIYASRPTSWMAALARNPALATSLQSEEASPQLLRLPGVRRSKFLVTCDLSAAMFSAPRLKLDAHAWRLSEKGTDLRTYRRLRPRLRQITANGPVSLTDLRKTLDEDAAVVRALVAVGCYEGTLMRAIPKSVWSNRWLYSSTPKDFEARLNQSQAQRDLARKYVSSYGPVHASDLAWWMGIAKSKAESILKGIEARQSNGFWTMPEVTCANDTSNARITFLPPWDPLVMGYAPGSPQRAALNLDVLGYDTAGNGLPVVLKDGRAVTQWRTRLVGKDRVMEIKTKDLSKSERALILEAGADWADLCNLKFEPTAEMYLD